MKSKLHSILIYPLILLFSYILKGKKTKYDNFFTNKIDELKNLNILNLEDNSKLSFFSQIKKFFDKNSPLYDKTFVSFTVDLQKNPEKKQKGLFDFYKNISMYYSCSMLSSRITNDNLYLNLLIDEKKISKENSDNLLRYILLVFASKKVDKLILDEKIINDKNFSLVYEYIKELLNGSTLINFSNSQDLYVLTCEQKKQKFDIIWSSSNREIELTKFNKVFNKFGKTLKNEEIKISQSPIVAYH